MSAILWGAIAFFALATVSLAIAFPLTYTFTCGPNKRDFFRDAPAQLKKIVRADEDIVKPNGCNVCPAADQAPVWIAPGDVCQLPGYGPDVFEHCDLDDDYDFENDYAIDHHFKACLPKEQIDHLWSTGHCHAANTTGLPFVAPDGLLFCGFWDDVVKRPFKAVSELLNVEVLGIRIPVGDWIGEVVEKTTDLKW